MTVSATGPRGVNCTCFSQVTPGSSSTGAAWAGSDEEHEDGEGRDETAEKAKHDPLRG